MTRLYDEITDNNNGAVFPNTRAIDSSGPLIPDGTEIIEGVIDDVWLEKQALLSFYNYPPNGLEDTAGIFPAAIGGLPDSQPLAVQYMNYATPGTIVNWASDLDPALVGATLGLEIRLILLHGQGVDIGVADFAMLDAITYVGDPDNATADAFYHAVDALGTIRNTGGNYLILPDVRGYSFRALDPSGLIDPEGAGRIVGSKQDDAFQEFEAFFHILRSQVAANGNVIDDTGVPGFTNLQNAFGVPTPSRRFDVINQSGQNMDRIILNTATIPTLKTSSETRAKNIATHFAIHY